MCFVTGSGLVRDGRGQCSECSDHPGGFGLKFARAAIGRQPRPGALPAADRTAQATPHPTATTGNDRAPAQHRPSTRPPALAGLPQTNSGQVESPKAPIRGPCRELEAPDPRPHWRCGDVYLVTTQPPTLSGDAHDRRLPGINHVALHRGSAADIDRPVGEATDHGGSSLYENRYPRAGGPDRYAAYLENEADFKVEVVGAFWPRRGCPS